MLFRSLKILICPSTIPGPHSSRTHLRLGAVKLKAQTKQIADVSARELLENALDDVERLAVKAVNYTFHNTGTAQLTDPSFRHIIFFGKLAMIEPVELFLYVGIADRARDTFRPGNVNGCSADHFGKFVEILDPDRRSIFSAT